MPRIAWNMVSLVKGNAGTTGLQANPEPWYRRSAFNEQGDDVAHLEPANEALVRNAMEKGRARVLRQSQEKVSEFQDEEAAIAALNRFESLASLRGARGVFAYPCFPELFSEKRTALDDWTATEDAFGWRSSISGCRPPADDFDKYHLGRRGGTSAPS